MIYDSSTLEQKLQFANGSMGAIERLVGSVEASEFPATDIGDKSTGNGLNNIPVSIAVRQYWIAMDKIVKVTLPNNNFNQKLSSDSSLPEETQARLNKMTTAATSAIRNYIYQTLKSHVAANETILGSLILQIYEAYSNPRHPDSPEICGLCAGPIPARSPALGSCASGHLFRKPACYLS